VQDCVCALDASCCNEAGLTWTANCAALARTDCRAACGSSCCHTQQTAGCDDSAVQACVCQADSFCCGTRWDALCVGRAANECGGACIGARGSCCTSNPGVSGCDDPDIESCVCALDSYCCDSQWDSLCVSSAQAECALACAVPPG
jgi:hypothetical protein